MKTWIVLLVAMLFASPAHAVFGWSKNNALSGGAVPVQDIAPNQTLFMLDSATGTALLKTDKCHGGFDLFWDSDTTSATAAATTTASMYWCPLMPTTFNQILCPDISYDVDGGGLDTNALTGETGKSAVYGIKAPILALTVANPGVKLYQAVITCRP